MSLVAEGKRICVMVFRPISDMQLGLYRISAPALAGIRHFFSESGRNPALAKISPEPDSFAGFEKSIFFQKLDNVEL